MIFTVFLVSADDAKIEHLEEAPELLDYDGRPFSLRGGPRTPQPTDHAWDPVAVYAPDELSEEEFLELFELHRKRIPELNLRY